MPWGRSAVTPPSALGRWDRALAVGKTEPIIRADALGGKMGRIKQELLGSERWSGMLLRNQGSRAEQGPSGRREGRRGWGSLNKVPVRRWH